MFLQRAVLLTLSLVALLPAAGCGGPKVLPEYPVKGTVTLDGSPMAEGEIYFIDPATSTSSVLTVANGQFEGKSEAGNFKVEINQFREETVQADATGYAPPGGTTKKNVVLPEYNANSTIKAEVKAGGPNEFKFEAKTK
jgi:hypothetical protein